jgi:hypothetical protein
MRPCPVRPGGDVKRLAQRGRATLVPVRYPAIAVAGGAVYLCGGDRDSSPADVVQEFDPLPGLPV